MTHFIHSPILNGPSRRPNKKYNPTPLISIEFIIIFYFWGKGLNKLLNIT